jgi:hypothetical protein
VLNLVGQRAGIYVCKTKTSMTTHSSNTIVK